MVHFILTLFPLAMSSPKSLPRNKQISKDPIVEPKSSESLTDVGGNSTASEEENGVGYVLVFSVEIFSVVDDH